MNKTEKRREELLEKTRSLYSDRKNIPAVHPRYGAIYNSMYNDNQLKEKSTLSIRFFFAMLLFVLFASADYKGISMGEYTCDEIVEVISNDIEVEKVWNSW